MCVGVYYVWREQGSSGGWRESVDEIAHGLGSGVYRRGPSKLASRAEQSTGHRAGLADQTRPEEEALLLLLMLLLATCTERRPFELASGERWYVV